MKRLLERCLMVREQEKNQLDLFVFLFFPLGRAGGTRTRLKFDLSYITVLAKSMFASNSPGYSVDFWAGSSSRCDQVHTVLQSAFADSLVDTCCKTLYGSTFPVHHTYNK